ncbi:MAG: YciI family protein [Acidobacteriota bacterium]
MATFIIIYRRGQAWIEGKSISEQPLEEHGKYILGLYGAGKLRFAGPFEDDSGGAAVIEAASEQEARSIARDDPAVTSGVFVYEIHPWKLVPWERYANAGEK